ncbi:MAG TPA: hypothetical protein VMH26_19575 [Burkholderiales bacterium]|nr:hypothetical protein [Burkholderiales bacterium]
MSPPRDRASDAAASGMAELVADDLERLVGRAGAALNLQCRAAHHELAQSQLLLADATRKLLDSFHAANHALAALDVEEAATRVEQNLLAATQHLQFSDLVGQLLATTEQRVDGLLLVSQRLQELVQAMGAPRTDPPAQDPQLAGEKRAFLEAIAALESCGDSRVKQWDTQAGGIELF